MKLFTQILILVGFVITIVEATAGNRLLASNKGLYLNPSEMEFPAESDYLVIPDGKQRGAVISKQKLGTALVEKFEDISEVDTISIVDDFYFKEGFIRFFTWGLSDIVSDYDYLTLSFRIKTNKESSTGVYLYIQCRAYASRAYIFLYDCESESENVKLTQRDAILISIIDINVSIDEYTGRTAISESS